jgi:hypothetical protein
LALNPGGFADFGERDRAPRSLDSNAALAQGVSRTPEWRRARRHMRFARDDVADSPRPRCADAAEPQDGRLRAALTTW